jgi:hypothetical protein
MAARANRARATELTLCGISFFEKHYDAFIEELRVAPQGAANERGYSTISKGGISFHYGKIQRLVDFIGGPSPEYKIGIAGVTDIYHLDGIASLVKKAIFVGLGIDTANYSKADLLVVTPSNNFFISVKDVSTPAKSGQKSGKVTYHSITMNGGHNLVLEHDFSIAEDFVASDTDLSAKQFAKLTNRDRVFAYIKANFPDDWASYVDESRAAAHNQLEILREGLERDPRVLLSFLSNILSGADELSDDYYVFIKGVLCSPKEIICELGRNGFYIGTKWKMAVDCGKNDSLIVDITWNETKYSLTKIHPSFEGAESHVSQTKGIINHFQEWNHAESGKNVWDLLLDITNLIVPRQSLINNQPSVEGD